MAYGTFVPKRNPMDWSRAGLKRLAEQGLDGVRVEVLAKDLGVTKGSFYWHFRDRQALLDSMLQQWERSATDEVIAATERSGPEAASRLARLVEISTAGFDAPLELALRAWGRSDSKIGAVIEAVDARRLATLRALLKELGFKGVAAEARAFLLYSALFGAALLPDSHGRTSRRRVLDEVFEILSGSNGRRSKNV
jgi:AcrR family transcriptional regulator